MENWNYEVNKMISIINECVLICETTKQLDSLQEPYKSNEEQESRLAEISNNLDCRIGLPGKIRDFLSIVQAYQQLGTHVHGLIFYRDMLVNKKHEIISFLTQSEKHMTNEGEPVKDIALDKIRGIVSTAELIKKNSKYYC